MKTEEIVHWKSGGYFTSDKMKNFVLILLFVVAMVQGNAQFTPSQWYIGQGGGGFLHLQKLDFDTAPVAVSIVTGTNNAITQTSAAIADGTHKLLYYTNGCRVFNWQHNIILNGDSLSPSANTSQFLLSGLDIPQMAVFLPDPADTNQFYLFHGSADLSSQNCLNLSGTGFVNKIYYSIINKTLDNGNGEVIDKNHLILNDTLGGSIIAIKHGNGRDWWIVIRHFNKAIWFSWLLSPIGVAGPFKQTIGPIACSGFSNLKFSKLSSKMACFRCDANWPNERFIDLYDFDRCTGLFSNAQTLNINNWAKMLYAGGCEISPSGRYLYAGVGDELHQFDMLAPNIQTSEVVVDTIDSVSFYSSSTFWGWGISQLGPDGKIYSKGITSNHSLSVINNPDSGAVACNAVHAGVVLPNYHYGDLPNIPLYELGPLAGSACDTITGMSTHYQPGEFQLKIYPNPAFGKLEISNSQLSIGQALFFKVYDVMGKLHLDQNVITTSNHFNLDVSNMVRGIYFLQVKQGDKVYNGRFVKE